MERKKIDAILKNAYFGPNCVSGNIYADTRERFKDGTVVTTSKIKAIYGDIVYTESGSVYYVVRG